ncbi:MAG: hypothetical protein M3R04_01890 [bacterium]|nr:hypothetical protein [bacterium]
MSDWQLQHLEHAIHPEAHPPEYVWHKYWARKPHNVVRQFIEHYCPPGGIVLDPFSGSGVTAIEAVRTGRLAIAVDINPIANEILRTTLLPVDLDALTAALAAIEESCKKDIQDLYITKCRACGKKTSALAYVWLRDTGGEHQLSQVRYKCEACGDEQPDGCEVDMADQRLMKNAQKKLGQHWYPDYPLRYSNGTRFMKAEKSSKIGDLFTSRNLHALSVINSAIEQYANSPSIYRVLKLILTSVVHLCSRLCPALSAGIGNHQTAYSSTWTLHSFWIPPRHLEMNVWVKWISGATGHQGMLKAKRATTDVFNGIMEAKTAKTLKWGASAKTSKPFVAYNLPWLVAEKQVNKELGRSNQSGFADYCFTDPPYDAEIQYGELSFLWNAWLYGKAWDVAGYLKTLEMWEAINNPQQGKDFESFSAGLYQSFRLILDSLKPGAYMHLTFHSPAQKIRNATIRSAVHAGFIYEKIHYQPPPVVSAKALLQPYGSAKGDYIFRFRKPQTFGKAMEYVDSGLARQLRDKESFAAIVVDTTKKLIAERGEPVPFTFIINHIDPVLNDRGFFLQYHADWKVEDVLGDSGEFVMKTITIAGKEGRAWWFADEEEALRTMRIPLSERVEQAVLGLMKQEGAVEFSKALDRVYIDFPNSFTPDSASVKSVLEEYAAKAGGLWRMSKTELLLESQHSTMIRNAAKVGRQLGFEVLIGRREAGEMRDGERLGELSTSEPDWSSYSKDDAERLKQVDCILHRQGRIEYVIEVENTTQFTEAMIRCQSLAQAVHKIFVVPLQRRPYIQRKLGNQLFTELVKRQGWRFLPYDTLASLAEKNRIGQADLWENSVIQFELDLHFGGPAKTARKPKRKPEPSLFEG